MKEKHRLKNTFFKETVAILHDKAEWSCSLIIIFLMTEDKKKRTSHV